MSRYRTIDAALEAVAELEKRNGELERALRKIREFSPEGSRSVNLQFIRWVCDAVLRETS